MFSNDAKKANIIIFNLLNIYDNFRLKKTFGFNSLFKNIPALQKIICVNPNPLSTATAASHPLCHAIKSLLLRTK